MAFMGIEVTLTNILPMHSDTAYSTNKSEAWWVTTVPSYIIAFSCNNDFYIIYHKYNIKKLIQHVYNIFSPSFYQSGHQE